MYNRLRGLVILFQCKLSTRHFCYVLSFPIFFIKVDLFSLHDLYLSILHVLLGGIFFRYFGMSFLLVLLDTVMLSFKFLFYR